MDFFEISSKHLEELTQNERGLFDYVIKNMNTLKNRSIREVAAECFVSTTTFLRFVRKIGFSGYSEFITVLKFTALEEPEINESPFVVEQKQYREEYLKNLIESVRVMESAKIVRICEVLKRKPRIVLLAKGLSKNVAYYTQFLYSVSGFDVLFPRDSQYRGITVQKIKPDDLVFVFNYEGHDRELVQMIETLRMRDQRPLIVSITGADNNMIQNMSDINLYIFTDEIEINGVDLTSRISIIALMELILYQHMEETMMTKLR